MNNELIERIEREITHIRGILSCAKGACPDDDYAELDSAIVLLRDCKAALSQPTELEMHRADYNAIKSAGFDSPGELLSAYNTLTKSAPQDVFEFIYTHGNSAARFENSRDVAPVDALTAWMAGHARVPVEPTKNMIRAGQIASRYWAASESKENGLAPIYRAMLTASKEVGNERT